MTRYRFFRAIKSWKIQQIDFCYRVKKNGDVCDDYYGLYSLFTVADIITYAIAFPLKKNMIFASNDLPLQHPHTVELLKFVVA